MSANEVELVYFTGCPNADAARDHIRQALTEMGRPADWAEWDLEHAATPDRYRSFGSPTVLLGGRDVTDAPASAVGLSCSAGGAPSVERILRALMP